MRISVELPDTAALVQLDQDYLKEALVATLYHLGKLSEKEACSALGISRRAFEELLPRFGFSISVGGTGVRSCTHASRLHKMSRASYRHNNMLACKT